MSIRYFIWVFVDNCNMISLDGKYALVYYTLYYIAFCSFARCFNVKKKQEIKEACAGFLSPVIVMRQSYFIY